MELLPVLIIFAIFFAGFYFVGRNAIQPRVNWTDQPISPPPRPRVKQTYYAKSRPVRETDHPTRANQTSSQESAEPRSSIDTLQAEIKKLSILNSYLYQEKANAEDLKAKFEKSCLDLKTKLEVAEDARGKLQKSCRDLKFQLETAEDAKAILENSCLDLKTKLEAATASPNTEGPRSRPSDGGTNKFTTAKRRFATLYHPDTMKHTGMDKLVREEFFKEFWSELEKIERAH